MAMRWWALTSCFWSSAVGSAVAGGGSADPDWLVRPPTTPVTLDNWSGLAGSGVVLSNGLISRKFALDKSRASWGTYDFISHLEDFGDASLLRAFSPEAVVTLDGVAYRIGGLIVNESQSAFLNRSIIAEPDPGAFHYVSHSTSVPVAPFSWSPGSRGAPSDVAWPPRGMELTIKFEAPPGAPPAVAATTVEIHYEMYVGHPILTKWVSVSTNVTASQSWHERQHLDPHEDAHSMGDIVSGSSAISSGADCGGSNGCSKCPGAVYMRVCSADGPTQAGESQDWHYSASNHSLLNSGLCLSSAGANPGSGCPHLTTCNASDPAQTWEITVQTENAGQIKSLDDGTCSGVSPPGCCASVTANRKDAGAWLNSPPCTAGGVNRFALIGTHLIEADTMLCAAATPGTAPPPPPSPLPGPPSPSPVERPAILTQIEVETLALNQPYSPMPFVAYGGQGGGVASSGNQPDGDGPRYNGDGKLHVELEYEYSDIVNFTLSFADSGASEPSLVTQFSPPLSTPVPSTRGQYAEAPFVSFRTYLLVLDDGPEQGGLRNPYSASSENDGGCALGPCVPGSGTQSEAGVTNERKGLARRKLLRLLAPQTQESPIFFHLTSSDQKVFDSAIEQMSATGFDMVIFSFGSGFQLENTDPQYYAQVKANVAKAKSKGIEVGAYDLIGWSRNSNSAVPGSMALAPDGHTLAAGACWASSWRDFLTERVNAMGNFTGLSMIETDGPYGGYSCSNSSHIHHHGEGDSVYMQVRGQGNFYRELRDKGFFVNAPDDYFFQGTNKEGVGYNENQFSLPREEQLVITRATLYEGTFIMPPTAVWSFVPLVQYHAGGGAASFWPPSQHIGDYELALAMHMSFGVAACYRGPGLYDTPEVKDMVAAWVGWFKQHRRILTSDLIHIRRPDGQSIDGIIHVNAASTDEIALAAFFNPTTQQLNTTFMLPLYYAGVAPTDVVNITRAEPVGARLAAKPQHENVNFRGILGSANYRSRVELEVVVPAGGYAMFSVRRH